MINKNDIKEFFPYPNIYLKEWGYEYWIENNDKYCMKLLHCEDGIWSSGGKFHYHKIKDETFFIVRGELRMDVEIDNTIRRITLTEGDTFRVKPNVKHRFCSVGVSCDFIEASTKHLDEDSYKCYWDFERRCWVDV